MTKDISKNKFFITGGGTGGHIYPAVSVVDNLLKKGAKKENIFYIGNKKNLEYKIINEKGLNFLSTPVFGMPRKITFNLIKWIFCLIFGILKSIFYILKYKPDVIFATGGYVCAPVLFAGTFLNIPYVLHDSDSHPGIVTRAFSKNAKAVNLAFIEAKKFINSKNIANFSNPVRSAFFEKTKEDTRKELNIGDEFLILIMGGSQGAKSVNKAAINVINHYKDKKDVKIILQTGRKNYDEVVKDFNIPDNARIEPYFDDMSTPILAADLIISRAGSISISEILSSKVPSILIPYPYAAADHQKINANAIMEKNAAIVLEDSTMDKDIEALKNEIEKLLNNKEKYKELKNNAEKIGENFKYATDKITNLVICAIKEGK